MILHLWNFLKMNFHNKFSTKLNLVLLLIYVLILIENNKIYLEILTLLKTSDLIELQI